MTTTDSSQTIQCINFSTAVLICSNIECESEYYLLCQKENCSCYATHQNCLKRKYEYHEEISSLKSNWSKQLNEIHLLYKKCIKELTKKYNDFVSKQRKFRKEVLLSAPTMIVQNKDNNELKEELKISQTYFQLFIDQICGLFIQIECQNQNKLINLLPKRENQSQKSSKISLVSNQEVIIKKLESLEMKIDELYHGCFSEKKNQKDDKLKQDIKKSVTVSIQQKVIKSNVTETSMTKQNIVVEQLQSDKPKIENNQTSKIHHIVKEIIIPATNANTINPILVNEKTKNQGKDILIASQNPLEIKIIKQKKEEQQQIKATKIFKSKEDVELDEQQQYLTKIKLKRKAENELKAKTNSLTTNNPSTTLNKEKKAPLIFNDDQEEEEQKSQIKGVNKNPAKKPLPSEKKINPQIKEHTNKIFFDENEQEENPFKIIKKIQHQNNPNINTSKSSISTITNQKTKKSTKQKNNTRKPIFDDDNDQPLQLQQQPKIKSDNVKNSKINAPPS